MRYEVRSLGSLPWPPGLGKGGSYSDLETALRAYLGDDDLVDPEVHRRAFVGGDPVYREIVVGHLSRRPWAKDLLDGVDAATEAARSAPLLGKSVPSEGPWLDWADRYREVNPVWAWLSNGLHIAGARIADGRHRLTYLRFHRPPEHQVLVRAEE